MGSDDSSKSIHVSQYTPQLYAFQCSVLQLKTLLLSSAFTFSSKSWMVLDASYNKQVSLRKETDNKNQNEKQNKRRRNEKRETKRRKENFPNLQPVPQNILLSVSPAPFFREYFNQRFLFFIHFFYLPLCLLQLIGKKLHVIQYIYMTKLKLQASWFYFSHLQC